MAQASPQRGPPCPYNDYINQREAKLLKKKEVAIAAVASIAAITAVTIGGIQSAKSYTEGRKCDELQARYNADRAEGQRLGAELGNFRTRVNNMAKVNYNAVVASAQYIYGKAFEIENRIKEHNIKVERNDAEFKLVCGQIRFDAASNVAKVSYN